MAYCNPILPAITLWRNANFVGLGRAWRYSKKFLNQFSNFFLSFRKALQLGYIITRFHQIWVFKKFSNNLFKKYIRTFFKIKTESSGWPENVKTVEDQAKFVEKFQRELNINIDPHKMEVNESFRYISKLLLNTVRVNFK